MGRAGAGGGGRSVGSGGHSAGRMSGGHSMGSSRPGSGSSGMGMGGMSSLRSGMGSGRPGSMGSSNRSGMNNGMGGMSHGPGAQPQRNPSPAKNPTPARPAPAPKPMPTPAPHRHVAPPPRRTGALGNYRLRRRYYNPCPYGLMISSTLTYLQLQAACDALYRMMSGTERPGDAMAVSIVFGRYLTVAEYAMCYEWLCGYMDCWGI